MEFKLIKFDNITEGRSSLISLEEMKNIPFKIKRVYYIYGLKPDEERGKHAHKNLEQVLICLHGSCTIILDNGKNRKFVDLSHPCDGLYIGRNIWREMKNFTEGCVLLVLASEYYDESEYIRDYDEFLKAL
ncbi:MAG: FdtA/QdtA family cupin domain-containing protein [Holosporaceae bacterium]|jgi:hypothetical protein|nr:FdtA/QdtA family cupin domain-containing protein [Holosporaceae bacterium]